MWIPGSPPAWAAMARPFPSVEEPQSGACRLAPSHYMITALHGGFACDRPPRSRSPRSARTDAVPSSASPRTRSRASLAEFPRRRRRSRTHRPRQRARRLRVEEYPNATPATVHHVRAALEAAIQKYATVTLCDRIAWSDEVTPKDVLNGALVRQGLTQELDHLA